MSDRERIAQVAHQKSGNEQIAQKTDKQIPNSGNEMDSLWWLFLKEWQERKSEFPKNYCRFNAVFLWHFCFSSCHHRFALRSKAS